MIAILDKVLKAILSLFVLSALNEQGIEVLEDYFYLAILYQLALFAYRPFALSNNVPLKRDYFYYFLWLSILLIVALSVDVEMFWIILLAPFQMAGYYLEATKTIKYYLISMLSTVLFYLIFGISKTTYMLFIIGNVFAVFVLLLTKYNTQQKKVSLVTFSGPLILNSIAVMLYTRIDVFILDYFSNGVSNEAYLTSVRLFDYCAMLITIISNYALIKVMNRERSMLYSPRSILAMTSIGLVLVLLLLPRISRFFIFNTEIFVIYIATLPFICLGLIRNNYLMKISRTGVVLRFSVIGVLLMVVLGLIGYLTLGITGLALSTLIVQISLILLSWDFITKALATNNHEIS